VNTLKYIKMATSSNFGNVFSILAASVWLPYNSHDVAAAAPHPELALRLFTGFHPLVSTSFILGDVWGMADEGLYRDNVGAETLVAPRTWSTKSIARFMI
jgi:P-type Mg2+ transporter